MAGQKRDGLLQGLARFVETRILLEGAAQDGPCVAIFRTERYGFFQFDDGFVELADLHIENAEGVGRVLQRRVHLTGAGELGDGVVYTVFEFVSHAQVVVELGVVGV